MLEEERKLRASVGSSRGFQNKVTPSTATKAPGTGFASKQSQELWDEDRERADLDSPFPGPCPRRIPSTWDTQRHHPRASKSTPWTKHLFHSAMPTERARSRGSISFLSPKQISQQTTGLPEVFGYVFIIPGAMKFQFPLEHETPPKLLFTMRDAGGE